MLAKRTMSCTLFGRLMEMCLSNVCPPTLPQAPSNEITATDPNFLAPTQSFAQKVTSPNIHISSEVLPSFNIWRRKDHPSTHEFEVDPTSMEFVLSFLINKIDVLTAKNEELQSKSEIMQSSLFTTLNNSVDSKISA